MKPHAHRWVSVVVNQLHIWECRICGARKLRHP